MNLNFCLHSLLDGCLLCNFLFGDGSLFFGDFCLLCLSFYLSNLRCSLLRLDLFGHCGLLNLGLNLGGCLFLNGSHLRLCLCFLFSFSNGGSLRGLRLNLCLHLWYFHWLSAHSQRFVLSSAQFSLSSLRFFLCSFGLGFCDLHRCVCD